MRGDVQAIFKETPHDKQVMMFSATLAKEIRGVCKKFMNKVRANWKQDKLTTAGRHSRAPVAIANPSSFNSSCASMQSYSCQLQRPTNQLHQPIATQAAWCRGTAAVWAIPQPCSGLSSLPRWAAQAQLQLAAVVAV